MHKQLFLRPAIGTAILLSIPLVMSIVDRNRPPGHGWHWGLPDFIVMGALLFGSGILYQWVSIKVNTTAQRAALGLAIAGVAFAVGER